MMDEFEIWVKSRGGSTMKRDGVYVESMTRLWLECWQAAIASQLTAAPVAWIHPFYLEGNALGFEASSVRLSEAQVPLYTAAPAQSMPDADTIMALVQEYAGNWAAMVSGRINDDAGLEKAEQIKDALLAILAAPKPSP